MNYNENKHNFTLIPEKNGKNTTSFRAAFSTKLKTSI